MDARELVDRATKRVEALFLDGGWDPELIALGVIGEVIWALADPAFAREVEAHVKDRLPLQHRVTVRVRKREP